MAYHKREIKKGVLHQFSKIKEEFEELEDAHDQDNKILEICECADLIGAIEAYTQMKYNITITDLKRMAEATKSAFEEGKR